jgi:hypothetical protein
MRVSAHQRCELIHTVHALKRIIMLIREMDGEGPPWAHTPPAMGQNSLSQGSCMAIKPYQRFSSSVSTDDDSEPVENELNSGESHRRR